MHLICPRPTGRRREVNYFDRGTGGQPKVALTDRRVIVKCLSIMTPKYLADLIVSIRVLFIVRKVSTFVLFLPLTKRTALTL